MAGHSRREGPNKACKYGIKMLGEVSDVNLPDGWIGLYHVSGGIVYLHTETRVVTWAMPYTIPKNASVRKHNIPLTAIPCFLQKQSLNECDALTENIDTGKQTGKEVASNDQSPNELEPCTKIIRVDKTVDSVGDSNNTPMVGAESPTIDCAEVSCRVDKELDQYNKIKFSHEPCPNNLNKRKKPSRRKKVSKDMEGCNNSTQITSSTPTGNSINGNVASPGNQLLSNGQSNRAELLMLTDADGLPDPSPGQSDASPCTNSTKYDSLEGEKDEYYKAFSSVTTPYEITPSSLHNYLSQIYEFSQLTAAELVDPVFRYTDYQEDDCKESKKLRTTGKTQFQILNEYCQREFKVIPHIAPLKHIKQVDGHSKNYFTVAVLIKNMKFGIATSTNTRGAKHAAAQITLNILDTSILKDHEPLAYMSIFDKIPINDKSVLPTIEEFLSFDLKYPFETLLIFLARNFPDFTETDIEYDVINTGGDDHPKQEFKMKYKDFSVAGVSENSKLTTEMAAQALICVLYPHLKWWGSVIRLTENYLEVSVELDADKSMTHDETEENVQFFF